jgi:hypothetical protein
VEVGGEFHSGVAPVILPSLSRTILIAGLG